MAHITVVQPSGNQQLDLPEGITLSLMELLKAYEYPVLGTCGGMALCGSCHVEVIAGMEHLHKKGDQEIEMLDSLPNAGNNSRLACQIQVAEDIDGLAIRILGEG